jgi:HSP20 family protein
MPVKSELNKTYWRKLLAGLEFDLLKPKNIIIMELTRKRPVTLSNMLTSNFGSLLNEFFEEGNEHIASFKPAIEVHEKKEGYHISAMLPGMSKDDITIEVDNNTLVISGERKNVQESEENKVHISEYHYGKFLRRLTLPKNADLNSIDAHLEHGILTLDISKKEELKPKQIVIK